MQVVLGCSLSPGCSEHKVKGNGISSELHQHQQKWPNWWKVAFTNGEKISKGREKSLF